MSNSIKNNFEEVYTPLFDKFKSSVQDIDLDKSPAPFIPVCGANYEFSPFQFAFVGMDAWCAKLKDYLESTDNSKFWDLMNYDKTDKEDYPELLDFTNNFGTSFWDFILKFLSMFYGISNSDIRKD